MFRALIDWMTEIPHWIRAFVDYIGLELYSFRHGWGCDLDDLEFDGPVLREADVDLERRREEFMERIDRHLERMKTDREYARRYRRSMRPTDIYMFVHDADTRRSVLTALTRKIRRRRTESR